MIPTHQFSTSGKTKYFGLEVDGQFIKLQSKKATTNLFEAVVMENKPLLFTKNAIYETNTDRLITNITRINSYKLFNYLNNTNLYNVTSNYSNQDSNRDHQHSTSKKQSNKNNEETKHFEILRAVEVAVDRVSDRRSEDCVSLVFADDRLQHDGIQDARDFVILPTCPYAFYTGEINEVISRIASEFFNGQPGAIDKMQRLRDELNFSLSRNLIDEECYKLIENNLGAEIKCLESIAGLDQQTAEFNARTAELDREFEATMLRIKSKSGNRGGRNKQLKKIA